MLQPMGSQRVGHDLVIEQQLGYDMSTRQALQTRLRTGFQHVPGTRNSFAQVGPLNAHFEFQHLDTHACFPPRVARSGWNEGGSTTSSSVAHHNEQMEGPGSDPLLGASHCLHQPRRCIPAVEHRCLELELQRGTDALLGCSLCWSPAFPGSSSLRTLAIFPEVGFLDWMVLLLFVF